jgi:hypothetical protein
MARKLGRCSRCKQPLTKPPHKQAGAQLCDDCYFGNMKHYPDGTYPDGTRPDHVNERETTWTLQPKHPWS